MFKKYYNYIYEYFEARTHMDWPFVAIYPDQLFHNLAGMDQEGAYIWIWFALNATMGFFCIQMAMSLGNPIELHVIDRYKELMLWSIAYAAYNNCGFLIFAMEHNRLLDALRNLEQANAIFAGMIHKQAALLNSYHTLYSKTSINSYSLSIDPYDRLYHATQLLPSSIKPVTRLIQLTFESDTNPVIIEFIIQKSPLLDLVNLTAGIALV